MTGKEKIGLVAAGASILFIFCFAWLVWPTKYRYFQVIAQRDVQVIVRINRFTGETCSLIPMNTPWMKRVAVYKPESAAPLSGVVLDQPPKSGAQGKDVLVIDPLEIGKTPEELAFERAKKALQEGAAPAAPQYVVVPCGK